MLLAALMTVAGAVGGAGLEDLKSGGDNGVPLCLSDFLPLFVSASVVSIDCASRPPSCQSTVVMSCRCFSNWTHAELVE
jgi:hypothetical protein